MSVVFIDLTSLSSSFLSAVFSLCKSTRWRFVSYVIDDFLDVFGQ